MDFFLIALEFFESLNKLLLFIIISCS